MVVADFLLSPEAQARKQDPAVWGDPTVLAMARSTPRTAQASTTCRAASRPWRRTSWGRPCPSRTRPG